MNHSARYRRVILPLVLINFQAKEHREEGFEYSKHTFLIKESNEQQNEFSSQKGAIYQKFLKVSDSIFDDSIDVHLCTCNLMHLF